VSDYRLLIFDWDGTLVDSIGRIVEAMHCAADACGLARCSDARVKGIIGLGYRFLRYHRLSRFTPIAGWMTIFYNSAPDGIFF
jgi:phosphoglycolate phosphatase-like HAD superfamily hydrolase